MKGGYLMKMKAVCERTGLTDRAVRYYIEEGLIDPAYVENYLGRRAYAFSEEDVAALRDIVVLRKYGFSVAEIRQMQDAPALIPPLVEALRERKRGAIADEQALLDVLQRTEAADCADIRELTSALSDAAERIAVPQEDAAHGVRQTVFRVICRVVSILFALLELFGCAAIVLDACMQYHYPKGSALVRVLAAVFLLPAVLTLVLPMIHVNRKWLQRLRRIFAILCVCFLLPSLFFSFGIVTRSETDDILNYRCFDADSLAGRSPLLQDLFPLWAPVKGERQYLYRDLPGFDPTYDVYAEWSLSPEDFWKEIEKARTVLDAHTSEVLTIRKGPWICLCSFPFHSAEDDPFEPVHDSYEYSIFAYNETELRVRYLDGYSLEDGFYQPYYLELDWD